MKIAIVSGGFDPIHIGHIELFKKARRQIGSVFVILNSDRFLTNKKGKPFMPFKERKVILENLNCVDLVIGSVYGLGSKIQSSSWLINGEERS